MADTLKRQAIIDAVKARLETIDGESTVTMHNGQSHTYDIDISGTTYKYKTSALMEGDVPGANIKDRQQTTVIAIGAHEHMLIVQIDLFAGAIPNDNPAASISADDALRLLIGDVTAAIGSDLTWGGLAQDTKPIGDEEIDVVQQGRVVSGCRMLIQIQYITEPWSPFA